MGSYDELKGEVEKMLQGVNRYNPDNIDDLEECTSLMIKENKYNKDILLTTLILYQFSPDRYKEPYVCHILLKTMMVFPRNDFTLAKYLIDADRMDTPEMRRVVELGKILESCNFALFWRLVRGEFRITEKAEEKYRQLLDIKRIIEPIVGFEDAVRIYACQVINVTYQRIEKPQLARLLGGVSDRMLASYAKAWNWEYHPGDNTYFIQNHEDTIKSRNIDEKLSFEQTPMCDTDFHRLAKAKTVVEFVQILGVEMYAENSCEADLSLDMLKTLNTGELINIGFRREDALKITAAFFQISSGNFNTKTEKTKKKQVQFSIVSPQRIYYEEEPSEPSLLDRLNKMEVPKRTQYSDYSASILTAAYLNNDHFMRQILRKGRSVADHSNRCGWTPLLFASQKGHCKAVDLLCNFGASLLSVDHRGRTALMLAASWGHSELVDLILKRIRRPPILLRPPISFEKYVEMKDNNGETALHLAVVANQVKCVMVLRKWDVNPMLHDGHNVSAFELAKKMGYTEIREILDPRKNAYGCVNGDFRLGNSA